MGTQLRYTPNGLPLTDYEREVLVVLMEECAEVTQAASKLIRFGKENRPAVGGETRPGRLNTEVLAEEIGHLRYLLTMVRSLDMYDANLEIEAQQNKHDKMRWFMQSTR